MLRCSLLVVVSVDKTFRSPLDHFNFMGSVDYSSILFERFSTYILSRENPENSEGKYESAFQNGDNFLIGYSRGKIADRGIIWYEKTLEKRWHKLGEGDTCLVSVKFRWIPFSGLRGEVEKCTNERIGPENTNLYRTLCSCFLSIFVKFQSAVSEENSKMSQSIWCQDGHLVHRIGPKNTNFVDSVNLLLPVKFRWIPFSGDRGEVNIIYQAIRGLAGVFTRLFTWNSYSVLSRFCFFNCDSYFE